MDDNWVTLRNGISEHNDGLVPLLRRMHAVVPTKWIPSGYWIVPAIPIEIGSIAPKTDWVGLEKAADIGGVKAVAQIIQADLLIPLLAGEKMANIVARLIGIGLSIVGIVEEWITLQIVAIPFQ